MSEQQRVVPLLTSKYLSACESGALYVLRQRLSSLIEPEKIVRVQTPNWRSWWKNLNDPQRGSSLAPPFLLVSFQEFSFAEHQNLRTNFQSGLIFRKNATQVVDLAMLSTRVNGQFKIVHRDTAAQINLGLTILAYLKAGAFNFEISFPGLPKASTCTVSTDDQSISINDGLAIEDTEAGDVSVIQLSFYGLFWSALEKTLQTAHRLDFEMFAKDPRVQTDSAVSVHTQSISLPR
jgi:hypothetical protein